MKQGSTVTLLKRRVLHYVKRVIPGRLRGETECQMACYCVAPSEGAGD